MNNYINKHHYKASFFMMLNGLLFSTVALANGPWVLEQDQETYSLTIVDERLDEKWLGTVKSDIAELTQRTYWLNYDRGLNDRLQLSLLLGYTQTRFEGSENNFSGLADSRIGLKYLLWEEYNNKPFSLALDFAGIIKGNYERSFAGSPHSPGDRVNGLEVSFPLSKTFQQFNVFSTIGYRWRDEGVPDDLFYTVGLGVQLTSAISTTLKYAVVDGLGGLTIGQAPFTPNDFHLAEEDKEILELNLSTGLTQHLSLFGGYAEVLDGRNAGDSQIFYLGLSWQP